MTNAELDAWLYEGRCRLEDIASNNLAWLAAELRRAGGPQSFINAAVAQSREKWRADIDATMRRLAAEAEETSW